MVVANLRISFAALLCCILLFACFGPSSAVKGEILQDSGEPFAGKEVVLVTLSDEDTVTVAKGASKREVPLSELGRKLDVLAGDRIVFETSGGTARWKTKTDDAGEFVMGGLEPGGYVLFRMVAGCVIQIGTDTGYIRVEVQEGETTDLGTITLLPSSESIVGHEQGS